MGAATHLRRRAGFDSTERSLPNLTGSPATPPPATPSPEATPSGRFGSTELAFPSTPPNHPQPQAGLPHLRRCIEFDSEERNLPLPTDSPTTPSPRASNRNKEAGSQGSLLLFYTIFLLYYITIFISLLYLFLFDLRLFSPLILQLSPFRSRLRRPRLPWIPQHSCNPRRSR